MKKYSSLVVILLLFFNTSLKADYLSNLTEEADKGDIVSQNNLKHYPQSTSRDPYFNLL